MREIPAAGAIWRRTAPHGTPYGAGPKMGEVVTH